MNEPGEASPVSAPNFFISVSGMEENAGRTLAETVGAYIREISRYVNMTALDGVTIAVDYVEALAGLDRGYETSYRLTPSSELVQGVAMAPLVRRDGVIKSHLVLNANFIYALAEPEHQDFAQALYLLAHECAHVELNMATDRAYPNTLLQTAYEDAYEAYRHGTAHVCWDEYGACRISTNFGRDPLSDYAEVFIHHLNETQARANEAIRAYRTHHDHDRIFSEMTTYYCNLTKAACYLLGHLDGKDMSVSDVPEITVALNDHWFKPYLEQLTSELRCIWSKYGEWEKDSFEALGDIAVDVLGEGGMYFTFDHGQVGFRIPYSANTMPAD